MLYYELKLLDRDNRTKVVQYDTYEDMSKAYWEFVADSNVRTIEIL